MANFNHHLSCIAALHRSLYVQQVHTYIYIYIYCIESAYWRLTSEGDGRQVDSEVEAADTSFDCNRQVIHVCLFVRGDCVVNNDTASSVGDKTLTIYYSHLSWKQQIFDCLLFHNSLQSVAYWHMSKCRELYFKQEPRYVPVYKQCKDCI